MRAVGTIVLFLLVHFVVKISDHFEMNFCSKIVQQTSSQFLLKSAIRTQGSSRICCKKKFPKPTKHFSTTTILHHSHDTSLPAGHIPVNFILKDGEVVKTLGREGEIALRLAQRYDIPMEGACEASLACTTCHCYVESENFFEMVNIVKTSF